MKLIQKTKINIFNYKLNKIKFNKIIKNYDYIIDGTDNFESKFLINDICLDYKKFLVVGAISKFDGHIFSFDFKNKNNPSLRDFYQEEVATDDILNCEYDGILGDCGRYCWHNTSKRNSKKKFLISAKI